MVYFARLPSGLIKIGATVDLKTRLSALSSDYGVDLTLLATMPGDRTTKFEIHKRFSHLQIGRTHLFQPGRDLLDLIGERRLLDATSTSVRFDKDRKR